MTSAESCYLSGMPNEIQSLLQDFGPGLTSDLISVLVENGLSSAAARKRIQRAEDDYSRMAGLRFEKNARFIYLTEQYGSRQFWDKFEKACYGSGKSYWGALTTLKAKGGVVPLSHFPRVAGTPAARKGQLSPARVLERLKAVNVLEEFEEGERAYVRYRPFFLGIENMAVSLANEIAEDVALEGIKDWARRIGFGSFGKFAIRGDEQPPQVAGITWDLTAPSYIRPLVSVSQKGVKPGFLVCDISLFGSIERPEAEAFLRKCDLASAPVGMPPIMPMIVGHVFSTDALELLKGKGILAITLRNLFGEELAQALRELVVMLTDMGARASVNPDHLLKVMNSLTQIEGGSSNLRGALFELVIGSLVKDVENGYLKTGDRRQDLVSGRKAEIDVQLDRGEQAGVLVIECKAKNANSRVSESDIRKWYGDRVPLIYSILTNGGSYKGKPFRFELWSNGDFSASGLKWLTEQPLVMDGYTVGWRDGKALKQYADKAKNTSLRTMLNDYYFHSPLRRVTANPSS